MSCSTNTDNENNIDPSLTIATSSPSKGTLTNNHDGTFAFDPNGQFETLALSQSEQVSFTYRITDSFGETSEATVTITVQGVNDAPTLVADNASVTATEDQSAVNTGTFADIDTGDSVTLTASVGTITQDDANGTWSWTIDAVDGPTGPITVTITATDGQGESTSTTFTYSVTNVAPNVNIVGYPSVLEGHLYTLTLASSDPGTDTIIGWDDHLGRRQRRADRG